MTFLAYAVVHSVKTANAYMKNFLNKQPWSFSPEFLGQLDLTNMLSLALSLNFLGWVGGRLGYKVFLIIGLNFLAICLIILSILLMNDVSARWPYYLTYVLIGMASCTAWPSCLSVM